MQQIHDVKLQAASYQEHRWEEQRCFNLDKVGNHEERPEFMGSAPNHRANQIIIAAN